MRTLSTLFFFISFSILLVIHIIALKLFLYWEFWWLDIPMHILGGIVIVLGVFALYDLKIFISKRFLHVVPVMLLVLIVALAWEVYDGLPVQGNYVVDTITDLCMGLLGGLLGYGIAISLNKL